MLEAPELHTGLQVGSHESRVEGENPLPRPADYPASDAAQDMVGVLVCKHTFPAHVELLINEQPQALLLRATVNPVSAQPVFMFRIAPPQLQDLALGLGELSEVRTGPPQACSGTSGWHLFPPETRMS